MRKKLVYFLTLIFVICSFNTTAFCDLGDFNDYSSDSGWDSSDWNNDSWGNNSWDSDGWNNDNDNGIGYYVGGGGTGGGGGGNILGAIIVAVIIIAVLSKYKNNGGGNSGRRDTQTVSDNQICVIPDNTNIIVDEIIKNDENFSQDRFMSWAKEVFITLQLAWSHRDWEKVRPFEKEELYRQHQLQIQEYINNGRINVIERININNAHLFEYRRDNQYEYLTVFMKTRMVDYIKDENTGQVLKGNPNVDCYPRYLLTFMRSNGVKTNQAVSNKSVTNCPNCGAPVQITSAGKCEYCDSIITTGQYDWVLTDIQGVKRNSDYGSGGVIINETKGE